MSRQQRKILQRKTPKVSYGKSALDLIEEALGLLKFSPALLLTYAVGSFPFILALLYFWSDMIRSPFASQHVAEASLGLTLLFVWMKSWQAVFVQQVLAHVRNIPDPEWPFRRVWRLIVMQTILPAWGFVVLPLALLLTVPFPWVYAFYQNVSVYGHGGEPHTGTVMKHAWQQARLWPKQNIIAIWLLSPWLLVLAAIFIVVGLPLIGTLQHSGWWVVLIIFLLLVSIPLNPIGMVIALNLAGAIMMIPWLAKTLFGIESMFTLSSLSAVNTTFAAIIYALAYLCLDPVIKVVYALRCFYGESIRTGEDLKVALRTLRQTAMLLCCGLVMACGLMCSTPVLAAETSTATTTLSDTPSAAVSSQELEEALKHVLHQAEYSWRLPRERVSPEDLEDREFHPFVQWIADALEGIAETVRSWGKTLKRWGQNIAEWWDDLFSDSDAVQQRSRRRTDWMPGVQALVFLLLAAIASVLAVLLWRFLKHRRQQEKTVMTQEVVRGPDITNADVDARELPEDGWLAMARDLIERGQMRLALRALYLATLACLADRELISIARFKSDRDYERELGRRAHALPDLPPVFAENMLMFQRAWYGLHNVNQATIDHFSANYQKLRTSVSLRT